MRHFIDTLDRIIKLVISLGYWWQYSLQRRLRLILGLKVPGICVVLNYHAVASQDRERFAAQLDFLTSLTKPLCADSCAPLEECRNYVVVTFDDGLQNVMDHAIPELIKRNIPGTVFLPTGYLGCAPGWEGIDCSVSDRVATVAKLQSINNGLISVGSHSVTHRKLTQLSKDEASWELTASRMELAGHLGRNIALFSFPYGDYNESLIELARQSGYQRVFTQMPTLAVAEFGEFVTGRVTVNPTDWLLEFRLKVCGAYCWLPAAIVAKRRVWAMLNHYLFPRQPQSIRR